MRPRKRTIFRRAFSQIRVYNECDLNAAIRGKLNQRSLRANYALFLTKRWKFMGGGYITSLESCRGGWRMRRFLFGRALRGAACILTLTCVCSVRAASGPVAYYTFDEVSGTVAQDSSGNGYNGTLTGGVTRVQGVLNGALAFDGSTGYVSIPNSPNLTGGSVTVAAWIYRQSGVQKKFVSKWDDNTGNYQFDFQVYTDSKLWFQLQNGANVGLVWQGTTVINLNQWYHVAAVADASTGQVSLYVNGVLETLQSQTSWDGTIRNVNMEMNIGRKATGGDYWSGSIDDVRIYNRALSAAEITALATAPPTAVADSFQTQVNTQLSVAVPGVLGNDIDPQAFGLNAVLDGTVSHGTLALNSNGSFTYTPAAGFVGIDSFTYHVVNSKNQTSAPVTVSLPIVTRWHLTIPIAGSYQVPSGSIYTPVYAFSTFGDPSGTINFMEITDTDDQAGGRDYDCEALLHTSSTIDHNTLFTGQAGAGQIGRNTSGYPDIMTFYAKYDFETATFSTSTPGSGTFIIQSRKPLAFDNTETLYARCWFNRGDGHPGPLISNLSVLADITCIHMPGAVMQGASQNTLTWTPSPANAAIAQQLYRASSSAGPFTLLQSFSDNTTSSFTDSTMVGGSTYYYKVVALGGGGIVGADSNVLAVMGISTTVTACNAPAAIVYGDATAALSATVSANQVVNSGAITFQLMNGASTVGSAVVSGTVTNGVASVDYAIPMGTPAGSYTIVASYSGNSTFISSTDNTKQLTIDVAPLSISADNLSRTYGAANPTLTGVITGIQNSDNISATYATSATPSSPVGNYSITPTVADPSSKLGNYSLTVTNGTLMVGKAPLVVTPANVSRSEERRV